MCCMCISLFVSAFILLIVMMFGFEFVVLMFGVVCYCVYFSGLVLGCLLAGLFCFVCVCLL